MANKTVTDDTQKISPDDLREKLQGFQGEIKGKVDDKKTTIAGAAAGAAMVLMIVFFLLGKRSGKKKSAIVEIRRV